MTESARIAESADALRRRIPAAPDLVFVLGSGLGEVVDVESGRTEIPYAEIPHFPPASIAGHSGALIAGTLAGRSVAVLRGRSHYYEGFGLDEVVRPVRALVRLGARFVVLTNAAGSANPKFGPGNLMVIVDHLNLMGANPLRGPNVGEGPRFPDLSGLYEVKAVKAAARSAKVALREGVFAALAGPTYETPAEVRMLRTLGADACGMSTVPEAIAARHAGARVAAVSCLTNFAAGLTKRPLTHDEVLETTRRSAGALGRLLKEIARRWR